MAAAQRMRLCYEGGTRPASAPSSECGGVVLGDIRQVNANLGRPTCSSYALHERRGSKRSASCESLETTRGTATTKSAPSERPIANKCAQAAAAVLPLAKTSSIITTERNRSSVTVSSPHQETASNSADAFAAHVAPELWSRFFLHKWRIICGVPGECSTVAA